MKSVDAGKSGCEFANPYRVDDYDIHWGFVPAAAGGFHPEVRIVRVAGIPDAPREVLQRVMPSVRASDQLAKIEALSWGRHLVLSGEILGC